MSNSRCMRCRSVPWFSFRLVVTTARNGFLASKGLGGESSAVSQASGLNLRTHKDPSDHTEHGNFKAGLLGQEETSPMRYRAFLAPHKAVIPAPPRGQSWVISVPVYRHWGWPETWGSLRPWYPLVGRAQGGPGPRRWFRKTEQGPGS